jgi:hypothetical protein
MKIFILTTLLAVLSCCRAEARDLYVDPGTGDDGTTSPLKTIRHAIRSAKTGDTIHLKPAVYHEYAGFYDKRGEPGKPITLDGHGATLEGSDAIDPATWTEVSPGLFKNDELLPTLNLAVAIRSATPSCYRSLRNQWL